MEALKSIQKGQVLLLENFSQNLQQITEVIQKGFEKLHNFNSTAPGPPPQISYPAAPSQLHSTTASTQAPFTAPPPAPPAPIVTAPAPPTPIAPTPPAPITPAPPPMAPPLATSTPTPGFVELDEDTSALLESLCSLPSSPRESVYTCYDSHPATPPPSNSIWSPYNPPTVPLKHMPSTAPSHLPQGRYFQATSSVSSSSLPPQSQSYGAAYPPIPLQQHSGSGSPYQEHSGSLKTVVGQQQQHQHSGSSYQPQIGIEQQPQDSLQTCQLETAPQHSGAHKPQHSRAAQFQPQELQQSEHSGAVPTALSLRPSWAMAHPGTRGVPTQPINFSPQKSVDEILAHNKGEGKAGKAAVHLAQFVFFGADMMRENTAATLDMTKMREIKNIILGKYGLKRCTQDKSALWDKCKKAIGQKCKNLRYNK